MCERCLRKIAVRVEKRQAFTGGKVSSDQFKCSFDLPVRLANDVEMPTTLVGIEHDEIAAGTWAEAVRQRSYFRQ
jgi:hypothetical protein